MTPGNVIFLSIYHYFSYFLVNDGFACAATHDDLFSRSISAGGGGGIPWGGGWCMEGAH